MAHQGPSGPSVLFLMKIKNLCHVLRLLESMLDFYVDFGPALPSGSPDPTFDLLVRSALALNRTASLWKETPGAEQMEICFLK